MNLIAPLSTVLVTCVLVFAGVAFTSKTSEAHKLCKQLFSTQQSTEIPALHREEIRARNLVFQTVLKEERRLLPIRYRMTPEKSLLLQLKTPTRPTPTFHRDDRIVGEVLTRRLALKPEGHTLKINRYIERHFSHGLMRYLFTAPDLGVTIIQADIAEAVQFLEKQGFDQI
ncbi:MAG: hypothetical protein C5B49_10870, partial [Bdellovibrio sp.]